MSEGLSKKQLKELRKLEKLQARNLEQKNSNFKWIAIAIVSVLFLFLFVGVVLVAKQKNKPVTSSGKVEISEMTGKERMVRTNPGEATDSAATSPKVITLVEYADLQCPACQTYHSVVKQLLAEYPDRVRLLFKHFPLLTIHPNAMPAALAAEAAGRQSKFFEFVDLAYEKQAEWSALPNATNKFAEYAGSLGLDVEQFKKDMNDPELKKSIEEQREEGLNNGVSGTPSFFLEGERIDNPAGIDEFRKLVDAKLSSSPRGQEPAVSLQPTNAPDTLPLQP